MPPPHHYVHDMDVAEIIITVRSGPEIRSETFHNVIRKMERK
jgi:hypothetical protein